MKITLDQKLCRGHGQCVIAAPAVFALGEDDIAYLLVDTISDDQRSAVLDAIELCPERAIDSEE